MSCSKAVEEAIKRHDYIDYNETDYGVHALIPEARVFDKVLGLREVYTLWARLNLAAVEEDDPLTRVGAEIVSKALAEYLCGPQSSTIKWNTEDATPCNPALNVYFNRCGRSTCAPVLYIANVNYAITDSIYFSDIRAFALPNNSSQCTSYPDNFPSDKKMSDPLYLCRYGYHDSQNKRYVVTFSSWDKTTNSYSFNIAAVGELSSDYAVAVAVNLVYQYGATYTKSPTDIYRYLYDIAVVYQ